MLQSNKRPNTVIFISSVPNAYIETERKTSTATSLFPGIDFATAYRALIGAFVRSDNEYAPSSHTISEARS